MLLIERHLLRQFAETVAAVAIVLLLVSLGAIIADLIQEIAHGKVPAGLLLSQAGLRSVRFVTLVLPLALFLGLMLAIGRLYADSEMAVLASVGLGPQQLWRPLFWVTLPVMLVVGSAALWLAPWSANKARDMIDVANRSFLIAGLEPGRFVELPGQAGILYVTELSLDGTHFKHLFVQREDKGRLDIITAHDGDLHLIGETQRMLRLQNGFRIEGALGARDFRIMHFEKNEIRVPDREAKDDDDLSAVSTYALFVSGKPSAVAEIHWRLAMPIFVTILAFFAVPLARSEPRQSRYGGVLIAILVYIIGIALIFVGTALIAHGSIPGWFGLWWLHIPLLALALWLYRTDGQIPAPKRGSSMIASPRTASLYLAKKVLLTTLMVWLVLVGFDVILALAEDLKDIGKENYTLSQAVLEVLFTAPRRAYTIFPTAAVIGCLLGLGGLAARSELTVMRAVGISKFQIGIGALLPLMALTVVMIINMESLAPAAEQRALALANGKSKDLIMARYSGLWAREGNMFLNARSGSPHVQGDRSWIELDDVRMYQFDSDGRLLSLAHAITADHNNDGWTLHTVERSIFESRSLRVEKHASERWETQLDDKSLEATLARTRYLTTRELDDNIVYLKRNQLDASKFEGEYWSRWFYPINVIALCLATLPFAFGSLRSGGFGKRLFLGILIGIGFLQVQTMFVNLSDVYRFDVRWAYTAPPLLLLAICWGWLAKRI